MIPASEISAVLVTRGDVDISQIRESLGIFHDVEIWNNSKRLDLKVWGRYAANLASKDVIAVQDDDCIVDWPVLLSAYDPVADRHRIVNAMTPEHAAHYRGACTLIGFGAIFHRDLLKCFDGWERDALFLSKCDRVFTALNPHRTIYPRIEMLPWATAENRCYRQPDYGKQVAAIERRIFERTGIRCR